MSGPGGTPPLDARRRLAELEARVSALERPWTLYDEHSALVSRVAALEAWKKHATTLLVELGRNPELVQECWDEHDGRARDRREAMQEDRG